VIHFLRPLNLIFNQHHHFLFLVINFITQVVKYFMNRIFLVFSIVIKDFLNFHSHFKDLKLIIPIIIYYFIIVLILI